VYGYETLYNQKWQTRDHMIPFKHFFLLLNALGHVSAAEQLRDVFAVSHGIGLIWNGKDAKVRSQTRKLVRSANPEVI